MTERTTVQLPTQLNVSTLRALMKQWPSQIATVELHFNDKQWATPTGMVGLACLIQRSQQTGSEVDLRFNNCDTVGYWSCMGFFRGLGLTPPEHQQGVAQPAAGRFAEMRKVGDINYVDALTQELVAATHPPEGSSKTFSHILSEAMNNVCQHSGAYGFSAAQYWRKTGRVEFCIADTGCGLMEALQSSYTPNDDADAIKLALKVGVTSRSPTFAQPQMRNRGVGLSCIERLVTANGGRFEVWSGNGMFANSGAPPYMTLNRWTGTLLTVSMSRDNLTADFRTVMQQLAVELRSVEAERKSTRRS